jgi:hypothetical protein
MSNSITRSIGLWLANDARLYRLCEAQAVDSLEVACDKESHAPSARNAAIEALALDIETIVNDGRPVVNGLWDGIIKDAMATVDWEELAKYFLSDKEIWMAFSSDAEDAVLFTDADAAREFLAEKLDPDNTMNAGQHLKIQALACGETVGIEGTTYTLAVNEG